VPTYQYACTACGHELEAVQSFTDDALTQCPACSGESLRKRFSAVGIVFKGSGFYRTDSRSGASSATVSSTSDSSSSSTSSSSTSSSTPATSSTSTSSSSSTASAPKAAATPAA
jgi:putative FmdB family regulatory protein